MYRCKLCKREIHKKGITLNGFYYHEKCFNSLQLCTCAYCHEDCTGNYVTYNHERVHGECLWNYVANMQGPDKANQIVLARFH